MQRIDLFAGAAEEHGIAYFEAAHGVAFAGMAAINDYFLSMMRQGQLAARLLEDIPQFRVEVPPV